MSTTWFNWFIVSMATARKKKTQYAEKSSNREAGWKFNIDEKCIQWWKNQKMDLCQVKEKIEGESLNRWPCQPHLSIPGYVDSWKTPFAEKQQWGKDYQPISLIKCKVIHFVMSTRQQHIKHKHNLSGIDETQIYLEQLLLPGLE